jgi:hypothetical protein
MSSLLHYPDDDVVEGGQHLRCLPPSHLAGILLQAHIAAVM